MSLQSKSRLRFTRLAATLLIVGLSRVIGSMVKVAADQGLQQPSLACNQVAPPEGAVTPGDYIADGGVSYFPFTDECMYPTPNGGYVVRPLSGWAPTWVFYSGWLLVLAAAGIATCSIARSARPAQVVPSPPRFGISDKPK